MEGHAQRLFLTWARPVAPAVALAAYGTYEFFRPESPADRILVVLAVSLAAALVYRALVPIVGFDRVLYALLVVDTLLLAAMTAALERPDVLALAYFWSIGIAAFFLGARATALTTALAAACAAAVPFLGDFDADPVVVFTDVLVLGLIGGLLAFLSGENRAAEALRAAERESAATALRLTERIRSSIRLDDVLGVTVRELGEAVHAERCLLRVFDERDAPAQLYEWEHGDLEPLAVVELPPAIAALAQRDGPTVVEDAATAEPELRAYLDTIGTRAVLVHPIRWGGRLVGVLGFHDVEPRSWRDALPLLDRVIPHVSSALAQAQLFAQQRETLERLEEIDRMREQLVATVSHELRTPLTSTLGFLLTLERPDLELDGVQRRRLLALARGEAERLALLVEDLLELTRLGQGRPLALTPVDVRETVERAARVLGFDARRPVRIDLPDGLVAHADRNRLLQVFSNLLTNALVHGAGTVTVSGRLEGEAVVVAVRDEGAPLPPQRAEELFVPFARWNEKAVGTGLGLPIARSIVEAHGGTLVYDAGAFVVRLPLR